MLILNRILVFILLVISILLVSFTLFASISEYGMQKFTLKQILYDEVCLNGIVYYETSKALAPKYTKEGKLVNCNNSTSK